MVFVDGRDDRVDSSGVSLIELHGLCATTSIDNGSDSRSGSVCGANIGADNMPSIVAQDFCNGCANITRSAGNQGDRGCAHNPLPSDSTAIHANAIVGYFFRNG